MGEDTHTHTHTPEYGYSPTPRRISTAAAHTLTTRATNCPLPGACGSGRLNPTLSILPPLRPHHLENLCPHVKKAPNTP